MKLTKRLLLKTFAAFILLYQKSHKLACQADAWYNEEKQQWWDRSCCSTMPTVLCDQCGQAFTRPPSMLAKNKHTFCSPQCFRVWQNKRVQLSCAYCGKAIIRPPSKATDRAFCSPECYWRDQQDFYSTYGYRDLEFTPRAVCVHFLIAHHVQENIVVEAKLGTYTPDISPYALPEEELARVLFAAGHYLLATLVREGKHLDEAEWPCHGPNWFHRRT